MRLTRASLANPAAVGIVAAVVAVAILVRRGVRHYLDNRYRRAALAEMRGLEDVDAIAALNKQIGAVGVFDGECRSAVKQFAPQIIDKVLKKFTPEEVCEGIGLCGNSTASNDLECTVCEAAAAYAIKRPRLWRTRSR